jgi:hypothetical protein
LHFEQQIAKHQRRERILQKIHLRTQEAAKAKANAPPTAAIRFEESDPLPYTSPAVHHHMSNSTRHAENITAWLAKNRNDQATEASNLL